MIGKRTNSVGVEDSTHELLKSGWGYTAVTHTDEIALEVCFLNLCTKQTDRKTVQNSVSKPRTVGCCVSLWSS